MYLWQKKSYPLPSITNGSSRTKTRLRGRCPWLLLLMQGGRGRGNNGPPRRRVGEGGGDQEVAPEKQDLDLS